MWNRKDLKERAKKVLRETYWKALLVSIIMGIFSGSYSPSFNFNRNSRGFEFFKLENFDILQIVMIVASFLVILIIGLGIRIFLGYPLEVGGRRFFVQSTDNNSDLNSIVYAFDKSRYLDIVKSMAWCGLFTFLWFLALIIPGIIKSYSYRMVPYILSDNPNIGYKRALTLSMQMTTDQKMDMFVLDLSFLGWVILGLCACCIGVVFVVPYLNATYAELYLDLRKNAIEKGFCTYDELNLELETESLI